METLKHILLGLGLISIGVYWIRNTYKNYDDLRGDKPLGYHYWQGYIAGGGFIIAGILEMFGYLKWQ